MEKKILILLMSCNQPLYLKEEEVCRKTFLKDADKLGVPYYFYKGTNQEHPTQLIDNEACTMFLPVSDDLSGTALKTTLALTEALKMEDWDYVVKTNVSTWLDVKKILNAVQTWEGRDDRNIYGARFIANRNSMKVPFPRGNFVILSRSLVEGFLMWSPKLINDKDMPKTDDTLMCLSLLYHLQKQLKDDYKSRLKEVPSVIIWADDIEESPEFTDALSIRCKDEKNLEETPENMLKAHKMKHSKKPRKYFRSMGLVETKFGLIEYERYGKLCMIEDRVKQKETSKEEEKENLPKE